MPWVGQPMQWDGPITVMVPTQKPCIVHVCHMIYICYHNESVFKYLNDVVILFRMRVKETGLEHGMGQY